MHCDPVGYTKMYPTAAEAVCRVVMRSDAVQLVSKRAALCCDKMWIMVGDEVEAVGYRAMKIGMVKNRNGGTHMVEIGDSAGCVVKQSLRRCVDL